MTDPFRLDPVDEYNHAPGPEPNFNESVYVNGFDPVGRYGGWMRLGNRVNEGHAETQVCLYLPDGRIACQFRRPDLTANDGFAAGGLEYEVLEPFKRIAMRYTGEVMVLDDPNLLRDPQTLFKTAPTAPARVEYELEAVSPMHGGEPTSDDQETMYGRDFSLGHFNQHMRVQAAMTVDGVRHTFEGFGWRDHSWGPRYWTNIYFYRLLIANFGPDRAMMLLKITDRDGRTRRQGVLQYDGAYEEITDMDLYTEWDAAKDPVRMRLGVRTARRGVLMEGEVLRLAPLRNRRKVGDQVLQSRIAEGLTLWRWDDREGMGVTEYIEILEDGEPVGYPL
ncbi:MAG: hypothetical protein H6977_01455 [Gammaproteobacteria bacterium]|nr:hypothetical protein [Gammaproteobacteria bacterium]MCP5198647.1 hypothetical protein [Gammaproteobacteria bacterium]